MYSNDASSEVVVWLERASTCISWVSLGSSVALPASSSALQVALFQYFQYCPY
jgi:hypothetical protein